MNDPVSRFMVVAAHARRELEDTSAGDAMKRAETASFPPARAGAETAWGDRTRGTCEEDEAPSTRAFKCAVNAWDGAMGEEDAEARATTPRRGKHGSSRGILSPSSLPRAKSGSLASESGTMERTKSVRFEDDLPHGFPERKSSFSSLQDDRLMEDVVGPLSGFVAVVLAVGFVALASRLATAAIAAIAVY